ncbi:nicotinate phosphoribosyltransferase [Thermostilla marina]
MNIFGSLYTRVPATATDLYQLTMACGYWKLGMDRRRAVFQATFRRNPFGGAFTIACGQHTAAQFLAGLQFSEDDVAYLETVTAADGSRLFPPEFLAELAKMYFVGNVYGVPEGSIVLPGEPILRVEAPLLWAQLVETPLLTLLNFQSLIATKAARVCLAAQGDPVLDFGLRRAQGLDGGVSASRAAYIGGCVGTSNVLAGKLFGIPVRGTHAHSWVMAFDDELRAFEGFAEAMPQNGILLVDTYDTHEGLKHAVVAARRFREKGHRLLAVRLDSGDLDYWSRTARRILDEAGLNDVKIVASGDLDEYRIDALKRAGAPIDLWGVGTRLATAYDEPALPGVYKLAAIETDHGTMRPCWKLSAQVEKRSPPGVVEVVRAYAGDRAQADILFAPQVEATPSGPWYDLQGLPLSLSLEDEENSVKAAESRLVPLFSRSGDPHAEAIDATGLHTLPEAEAVARARKRVQEELARLPEACLRIRHPEPFPVIVSHKTRQAWSALWNDSAEEPS